MNWVIGGTIAYVAAIAFICRLFRHATDPEPCYVDPELAEAVRQALRDDLMDLADATRERRERLITDQELAEFEQEFR